jgi:hypothetical protein
MHRSPLITHSQRNAILVLDDEQDQARWTQEAAPGHAADLRCWGVAHLVPARSGREDIPRVEGVDGVRVAEGRSVARPGSAREDTRRVSGAAGSQPGEHGVPARPVIFHGSTVGTCARLVRRHPC